MNWSGRFSASEWLEILQETIYVPCRGTCITQVWLNHAPKGGGVVWGSTEARSKYATNTTESGAFAMFGGRCAGSMRPLGP
jgi:putative heme degradation protein